MWWEEEHDGELDAAHEVQTKTEAHRVDKKDGWAAEYARAIRHIDGQRADLEAQAWASAEARGSIRRHGHDHEESADNSEQLSTTIICRSSIKWDAAEPGEWLATVLWQ